MQTYAAKTVNTAIANVQLTVALNVKHNKFDLFCLHLQTMRGLCKEEDYAFLGEAEKMAEEGKEDDEGVRATEDDWRVQKQERVKDKDTFCIYFDLFHFFVQ